MYYPPNVTDADLNVDSKLIEKFRMTSKMKEREAAKEREKNNWDAYYAETINAVEISEVTDSVNCPESGMGKSRFFKWNEDEMNKIAGSGQTVREAQLEIHYNPISSSSTNYGYYETIFVAYQQTVACTDSIYPYAKVVLDMKHIRADEPTYIKFNVTKAVRDWVACTDSKSNGIEIQVFSSRQCALPSSSSLSPYGQSSQSLISEASTDYSQSIKVDDDAPMDNRPHLFVVTESSPQSKLLRRKRRRRQAVDLEYCNSLSGNEAENCCVREFYIDFKNDLNWLWILEPKGIWVNDCSGECPLLWAENGNYTQIINEYRFLNPEASVAPCCSPKTLEDIDIYHLPGGTGPPIVSVLTDASVTSCVCS